MTKPRAIRHRYMPFALIDRFNGPVRTYEAGMNHEARIRAQLAARPYTWFSAKKRGWIESDPRSLLSFWAEKPGVLV